MYVYIYIYIYIYIFVYIFIDVHMYIDVHIYIRTHTDRHVHPPHTLWSHGRSTAMRPVHYQTFNCCVARSFSESLSPKPRQKPLWL